MSESQQQSHPEISIRIIYVDRDINMREMMEMLLLSARHQVVTVRTAEEGLKMLEAKGQFDIVISSFRLAGMNGMEFLREVSVKYPETVRILMASSCGDVGDINQAIRNGQISRLAIKPYCLSTILEQLQADIASARFQQQYTDPNPNLKDRCLPC